MSATPAKPSLARCFQVHLNERCTVLRRDPNSSWLDLDGWFDDFMVADHHNLSEQTALLTSTLASIDWNSVLTSFGVIDEPLSPEDLAPLMNVWNAESTMFTKFASMTPVRGVKAPPSQTCRNRMPAFDGMWATLTSPKRIKAIVDASADLVNKLMRIDWSSTINTPVCSSSDAGCGAFRDEGSCNDAVVVPEGARQCPYVEDGYCDETVPGYPATAGPSAQFAQWAASFGRGGTDASQGVGACAPGTDEADCNQGTPGYPRQDNTRRGQIQWGPYPEADLGRCEWREGRSASQSRCVYAPDRGCTGWEAAPEILVSPAMSDEATHGFGPGLVSGLREISQAFQQGLPEPVASSWFDVSGWVLDELNTDAWSDVVRALLGADPSRDPHSRRVWRQGAQCVRFIDAFSSVDWSQLDFEVDQVSTAC